MDAEEHSMHPREASTLRYLDRFFPGKCGLWTRKRVGVALGRTSGARFHQCYAKSMIWFGGGDSV